MSLLTEVFSWVDQSLLKRGRNLSRRSLLKQKKKKTVTVN